MPNIYSAKTKLMLNDFSETWLHFSNQFWSKLNGFYISTAWLQTSNLQQWEPKLVSNTKYQPQLIPYKAFCVQPTTDNTYICLHIFTYCMATKGHATCCPFHEMHFNPTNNPHFTGIVGVSWFHCPDWR